MIMPLQILSHVIMLAKGTLNIYDLGVDELTGKAGQKVVPPH